MEQTKTKVKQVCDAKGIKYSWVADQLGISRSYFDHIESGRRLAPKWYYSRLASILQVPEAFVRPDAEPVGVAV